MTGIFVHIFRTLSVSISCVHTKVLKTSNTSLQETPKCITFFLPYPSLWLYLQFKAYEFIKSIHFFTEVYIMYVPIHNLYYCKVFFLVFLKNFLSASLACSSISPKLLARNVVMNAFGCITSSALIMRFLFK